MDLRKCSRSDGNTSLHWASCGRIRAVSTLISLGADTNAANHKGITPLILAASCGQAEIVRILLDNGADSSLATKIEQQTAWHVAAQRDFSDVLRVLIEHHNRIDKNSTSGRLAGFLAADSFGNTPLHCACGNNRQALSALLTVIVGEELDVTNNDGETPLLLVARVGYSEEARLLLQHGADARKVTNIGDTVLHNAAQRGNAHLLRELVSHPNCPAVDSTNLEGLTPLLTAVRQRRVGAASYLLQCGADATRAMPDTKATSLHLAIIDGDPDIVQHLLTHYPYIDYLLNENSQFGQPYQLAVTKKENCSHQGREADLRLQVLELLEAAKNGGLNWSRRRHYAAFLSGILRTEQLLWLTPNHCRSCRSIEQVFRAQDTQMLIGKFL